MDILRAAVALGLDVIAITDHDRIDGALEAALIAQAEGLPIEVVIGSEITTAEGDLLGLYLRDPIPPRLSLAEAIAAVTADGGLSVCAHPFVPHPKSIGASSVRRLVAAGKGPDGLESHNPTPGGRLARANIRKTAAALGLALTGGSDAHRVSSIGQAWTVFPGRSALDLRVALWTAQTAGAGSDNSLWGLVPILRALVRERLGRSRGEPFG